MGGSNRSVVYHTRFEVIFLDTNYLVRLIAEPRNDTEREMSTTAIRLMKNVADGVARVTTCDAVIAEAVYALSGKQILATRYQIAIGLTLLLQYPGFVVHQKQAWLMAFDLWLESPGLSFVDALGAAYSIIDGHELATFDKRLARQPGLTKYESGAQ